MGSKAENISVKDLFVLNTITFEWKEITNRINPSERTDFTWNKIGSKKGIIIGGATSPSDYLLDDVWMFEFDSKINLFEENTKDISYCFWKKLNTFNNSKSEASKLRGHSSEYIDDLNMVYVFGGIKSNKDCTNDLQTLNLSNNSWDIIQTNGKSPKPRCFHKIITINKDYLVVYGGITSELSCFKEILCDVYLFNLRDKVWTEAIIGGLGPTGRFAYSIVKLTNGLTYHDSNTKIQKRFHSKDISVINNNNSYVLNKESVSILIIGGYSNNNDNKIYEILEYSKKIKYHLYTIMLLLTTL